MGENLRKLNLRRNNLIYYCIDDDRIPYKGVRGKGTVRISDDVDYNLPIIDKIVIKYLGSIVHPVSQTVISNIREGDAILLEITPKFYATWDHGKVKGRVVTLFTLNPVQNDISINGSIAANNLEGLMQGKTVAELIDAIENNATCVNVHTERNPNGEVRGQLVDMQ